MSKLPETRAGFVAVIGLPNAGKSTLINTLVGTKVSIVSRKVQTTRQCVQGIVIHDQSQIIFVDTPGIFTPKKSLEKAMVKAAWGAVPEADILIHLVDSRSKGALELNDHIIKALPENQLCILVLNKTDAIQKPDLLALAAGFNNRHAYDDTFMVSGLKGHGLKDLLSGIARYLPKSPWLFGEDEITDMPMRMMAAEITREKIFDRLHQEIPYAIAVRTELWEEGARGDLTLHQTIYVQRDSQKGIVIGKGGRQLKTIGQSARKELEDILERRVHLKLFVRVQENWPEREEFWGEL